MGKKSRRAFRARQGHVGRPHSTAKAASEASFLQGVDDSRGWFVVHDWKPGAWQADVAPLSMDRMMSHPTAFACMTLIAGDIAKLRVKLVERTRDGIWIEITTPAFSPVLAKPNGFQTRQQFIEYWQLSLQSRGNTYVLKERDGRNVVTGLYILDPTRCHPLVAPDGSVYYGIGRDDLSHVPDDIEAIPASEIIHDRFNCLFHPLVGVAPLYACSLPATQGTKILRHSVRFFENMSRPSGFLTAPGQINDTTARRIKEQWERNYGGDNVGKVAVLGDNLKYEPMTMKPVDAQLTEQIKLSDEQICRAFHVPAFKVNVGPTPTYQNVEVLDQIYYKDCLQKLMKAMQTCLNDGLGLDAIVGRTLGVHFDLDDLMLMDSSTAVKSLNDAVGGGWMAPDEARAKRNLPPVPGGASPYMQQQQFSLEALAERDSNKPFAKPAAPPPAAPAPPANDQAKRIDELAEKLQRMEKDEADLEAFAKSFTEHFEQLEMVDD